MALLRRDHGPDWRSSQPYLQRSADGGRTWSPPEPLMEHPGLMFRSKPLWMGDRLILPVYDENRWVSFMMISDDEGRTWHLTEPIITPPGNIHPTVVPVANGRLLAYLRPGGAGGVIWRTESEDGGETWSPPVPTPWPNPNSGFDLVRLHSGRLALAYNPSTTMRTPLAVAIAAHGEEGWRQRLLEKGLAEFSYPTMWHHTNGEIHVVYTYRRTHIQHAYFTEPWLLRGEHLHLERLVNAQTT
ncbi:MAG: exo-alpha-sialidase [Ardenticatenia bacterium]|nr:exo-alpha-sialidase [Ardenticatenia bacterium]